MDVIGRWIKKQIDKYNYNYLNIDRQIDRQIDCAEFDFNSNDSSKIDQL